MTIKNKKLALSIFILLLVIISGVIVYFLFFHKCPYEIGTNIIEWIKQPCPYVIQGVIIDRISEEAVSNVVISWSKGEVRSSTQGEFVIKFRGEVDKIILNKEGYHAKEITILLSEENKEINLNKVSLEPEARVIGTIIDWLSERPLSEVNLTFSSKGEVHSSDQGEFIIKTSNEIDREDINKLIIKKDGYQDKEVEVSIGENEREVDLRKINLVPEGKVIYQKGNSIFDANFDGSESKKLTDGELATIAPIYDKFVFKTQDSALRLMDVYGNNQMKFAYQPSRWDRPTFTTFSLNGNIVAWISSYEVPGPQGKTRNEEIIYFNFELDRQDNVRQTFKIINTFRISPDGKYIAVTGISFQDKHIIHLEDIVRHLMILQGYNPEMYFFDEENFYYNVINSGWYVYNLRDGKKDSFDLEPSWWRNRCSGIINPHTKKNIAILQPGWAIKLADINGLNAKRLTELEPPSGYVKNLKWSSNKNYLLFEISQPYSLWVLDINSSKYKKITDL